MLRETTAVALSCLLTLGPSASAWAAPSNGTVSGRVTVEGQPLQGLGLAVVDLKSGEIHRTKSDAKGNYRVRVQPGEYVVTSLSLAGLGVGRAPARVVVEAGRVVVASLELMKLPIVYQAQAPAQTPPAPGPQTYGNITWDPPGCLVAGQFPLIEATIEPAASIARARVYFKSALSPAYYFVEMTLQPASASQMGGTKLASSQISGTLLGAAQPPGAPGGGKFVGKLPKPKLEASPVTVYAFAIKTDGVESQTGEVEMMVVADESECPEGVKVAPIGPAGAVVVFSGSSALVTVPVGFAAGGLAIAGGTLAAVLLGAGAVAGGIAAGTGGTPTTIPTATTTTTTTPPSTTTTTTTTTVPPRACEFVIENCRFDPVTELPSNCPCLPVGERCATRVVGQPCPISFPNDRVTECCTNPISCSEIGQPTLPAPRNEPCDRSLPPVIIGK